MISVQFLKSKETKNYGKKPSLLRKKLVGCTIGGTCTKARKQCTIYYNEVWQNLTNNSPEIANEDYDAYLQTFAGLLLLQDPTLPHCNILYIFPLPILHPTNNQFLHKDVFDLLIPLFFCSSARSLDIASLVYLLQCLNSSYQYRVS